MIILLVILLALLVYTWVLYPLSMMVVSRAEPTPSPSREGSGREENPPPAPPGRGAGGGVGTSPKEFPSSEGLGVGFSPPVAILFSAHNEEAVIQERLENLDRLDYPAEKIQVYAGIDGGSDRTAEIAVEWAKSHPNVTVFAEPKNHGKMVMLKKLVGEVETLDVRRETLNVKGETLGVRRKTLDDSPLTSHVSRFTSHISHLTSHILVFTDANTMFAPDALRRLVAPFEDPKVGGVCGRLVFVAKETVDHRHQTSDHRPQTPDLRPQTSARIQGEADASRSEVCGLMSVVSSVSGTDEPVYWNFETRLKMAESSLDSCLGANGAIYAVRSELFSMDIPGNTIIDDFVIGIKVREQGYRMVYEPGAVATEDLPETVQDEWRRRIRIGAGAYQALSLCRACLSPRYGVFAWMFWSHKVLRWVTPHLGLLLLAASGGLVVAASRAERGGNWALWCVPGAAGVVVCLAGVAGWFLRNSRMGWARPLRLLGYFLAMQTALFVGFLRFCRGNLSGAWERTERSDEPV